MRNYLTLVIGLVIVASPAFASKARLVSLGESPNGSLFINDARNMFYNAAFINDFKKKLILEAGTASQASDTTAAPKAEGGFTNTFGDFAYGFYFGRESETTRALYAALNTVGTTDFVTADNALDFFFGGDAGIKWGVNLSYASKHDKNANTGANANMSQTASQLITRLGVVAGNLQAFANIGVITKSKGSFTSATTTRAADEMNGKIGLDLGAAYSLENWTPFARMTMGGIEYKPNGTKASELNTMSVEVGAGYKKDVTKNTNLFSRVEIGYATSTTKIVSPAAEAVSKNLNIPVTVGAETQALNWLAVRASVSQSILGKNFASTGSTADIANSTQVAAGVGMTFGDLQIDGLVATSGGANNSNIGGSPTAPTSGAAAGTNANWGLGNNMITNIGLTYNF